jgi:hypothetical protein
MQKKKDSGFVIRRQFAIVSRRYLSEKNSHRYKTFLRDYAESYNLVVLRQIFLKIKKKVQTQYDF